VKGLRSTISHSHLFRSLLAQRAPLLQHNQSKLKLASMAAAATCIMMTPLDTVKTRLITQVCTCISLA
jgi:hypothetical protein